MIPIKTTKEIEIMTEGGKILAKIMKELVRRVEPGITTYELDRAAQALIFKSGGECSFKGYSGDNRSNREPFPACLCTSINEEIVHVTPSERALKEGDIISLDLGIFYKGFHTDMARTLPVGEVKPEVQRLIRATKKALKRGIKKIRIGNTFGDVSNTIQRHIEGQNFNVIKDLCGHGIGKKLHEDPQILNYGKRRAGSELIEGMVFCLEPMTAVGDWRIKKTEDGHGFKTQDNSLSAHFEDTIAITKSGSKVLTKI